MALERERIVRTALALLDEVGLEGLTLRRLADELGVRAPTLYWHVASKQQLLDEMATRMLADLVAARAAEPGASWRRMMRTMAAAQRAMLLAHRDGAKVFAGTHLTDDSLLRAQELPLRVLTDAGFTLAQAVHGSRALWAFVVGYVIEEQAAWPEPGRRDARYDPETRVARVDAERYPLTAAASEALFGAPEVGFTEGVELIVAGMAARRATADVPAAQPGFLSAERPS